MKELNTDRIGRRPSVYKVWLDKEEYIFETDADIVYAVNFQPYEVFPGVPAYWFGVTNRSGKASPNDIKLRATIICIIEEFFRENPDILLYMCDTADDQQAMRNRLFLRWFNGYEQQKLYAIRTAVVKDEGVENYIALIIQRNHPLFSEIMDVFDKEILMFQEMKP